MVCGKMEHARGTMTKRKQPTPSTWKGAWSTGLDLNHSFFSILCMMTGRQNIPGAAMATLEITTWRRTLKWSLRGCLPDL
jgi:hypothetical protein